MNKAFGSYLPLEIQPVNSKIFHENAIYLNTGRNAFEYILRVKNIKKVLIPYFSCDALFTPLKRLKIKYEFYSIDKNQVPIFNFSKLEEGEYFLYINYLGLRSNIVEFLSESVNNLIVDNTQAFFCKSFKSVPTFYSTRKFFGVPDGSVLCNIDENLSLNEDRSAGRMQHLILRMENETEVGYSDYVKVENELDNIPLMKMSPITQKLMLSVDYEYHKSIRNKNFSYLSSKFHTINKFQFENYDGPLAYPLWIENGRSIRKELIKNRIFIPKFWPNVLDVVYEKSFEYQMTEDILPIPVDSRYSPQNLSRIVKLIYSFI